MDWVDLTVAAMFAAAAATISNQYRGLISIFATAAIGCMGSIQVFAAYQVPGMSKFTLTNILSDGVTCGDDETSCWMSGFACMSLLVGGTMNQFKMQEIDFSLPAVTAYERYLHKVEKTMSLLFALSDYIDGLSLDTSDMMERCLQARDKLVIYANIITNCMHFSLCFGFAADFVLSLRAGVFSAVPWVGVASLSLALVTPIQGGIGLISDVLTSRRFALRMKEVVVPKWLSRNCSRRVPILGKPSFIVKFGAIGAKFQQASFYFAII
eukprot:COSAG05_NODE_773_length_7441_cov_3.657042_1_plen_267_part_10